MSAKGVLPSDWSCYACLSEAEQVQIDEETREFAKLIVNTFNPQPL
jgi:hypothetical protein